MSVSTMLDGSILYEDLCVLFLFGSKCVVSEDGDGDESLKKE